MFRMDYGVRLGVSVSFPFLCLAMRGPLLHDAWFGAIIPVTSLNAILNCGFKEMRHDPRPQVERTRTP